MLDPSDLARRIVALLPLTVALVACDPYGDARVGLTPDERARFDRGVRLATPCWSCHDITGTGSKVGPHLQRLMGREIGSLPGYGYSPGFRQANGTWNRATLDAFLADVDGFIPGSRMISPGLPDRGQRADLVFFLERVTRVP